MLRMEPAHEEGGIREWSALTTHFSGDEHGNVKKLHGIRVGPKPAMEPVLGSEFSIDADLVLVAIGFSGPQKQGMLEQVPLEFDARGNIKTSETYMTSAPGIFSAGDMRRGQSLIVWAIAEGPEGGAPRRSVFDGVERAALLGKRDVQPKGRVMLTGCSSGYPGRSAICWRSRAHTSASGIDC